MRTAVLVRQVAMSVLVLMASCLHSRVWAQWNSCTGGICYTGGDVGIGTTGPLYFLDVESKGSVASGMHDIGWIGRTSTSESALIVSYHANGTLADYPIVRSGGYSAAGLALSGDSSHSAELFIQSGGNVGIGTTSPQHSLHVAGVIGAEEVIVSSTGADYVFQPGYRLKPLAEVAKYIKQNGHLPGVPSAQEVQDKGVGLGDMQTKLLAKVEELTLHMIQAEARSQKIETENRELRERVARLESQVAATGDVPPSRCENDPRVCNGSPVSGAV
jgi:hypothetical protein